MSERPKVWSESRIMVKMVKQIDIVEGSFVLTGGGNASIDFNVLDYEMTDVIVDVESDEWLDTLRRARMVYTDGGVFRPKRCEVGSWAWVATDQHDNEVACQYGWIERGPTTPEGISNNATELAAALRALAWMTKATPGWSGMLCTDSQITIGRLSQGWRLRGIPTSWIGRMRDILDSCGPVVYVPMKGHPTKAELGDKLGKSRRSGRTYTASKHQVKCDRLCNDVLERWSELSGITR